MTLHMIHVFAYYTHFGVHMICAHCLSNAYKNYFLIIYTASNLNSNRTLGTSLLLGY